VCTEGETKKEEVQTNTTVTVVSETAASIALRTVPIYLKNGKKKLSQRLVG